MHSSLKCQVIFAKYKNYSIKWACLTRPLSSVIPIIISESETEKMDFDQTKNININEMLCELSIK